MTTIEQTILANLIHNEQYTLMSEIREGLPTGFCVCDAFLATHNSEEEGDIIEGGRKKTTHL